MNSIQEVGYNAGYEAGYKEGVRSGREGFGRFFNGTSIIIPSYNQLRYLKECIDSIRAYTPQAYEIIVVDNASTDGTAAYLRQQSVRDTKLRFITLETNAGFAGAVNRGLMLAKGTTLLPLNNDTHVTPGWLHNLLVCLNSDPMIGIVGPVTNFISGEQQIPVSYRTIRGMLSYARRHNVIDPAKWRETERLTGFCMLLRRELWNKIGYLDEGYAIGNYEDDDYNVRTRLLGYKLVIAADTFIHHYGSVSIRALGKKIRQVTEKNRSFYESKWGNLEQLLTEAGIAPHPSGETAFYPQGVVVHSDEGKHYWLEGGKRRPVEGEAAWQAWLAWHSIHISRLKLLQWPMGEVIRVEEMAGLQLSYLHKTADGQTYWIENGIKRRMVSTAAVAAWGLHSRQQGGNTADVIALPDGLPVIAPERVSRGL